MCTIKTAKGVPQSVETLVLALEGRARGHREHVQVGVENLLEECLVGSWRGFEDSSGFVKSTCGCRPAVDAQITVALPPALLDLFFTAIMHAMLPSLRCAANQLIQLVLTHSRLHGSIFEYMVGAQLVITAAAHTD